MQASHAPAGAWIKLAGKERERRIRFNVLVVICTYQNEEVCVLVVWT